jgi:uncharacterized protein YbjT (DUF2867 family)
MHAVVAGGTGLVGGALLRLLSAEARYDRVTSLVRRDVPQPPRVIAEKVDFDRLDDVTLPQVDDAFCCLGTTRRDAGSAEAFRRVDFDYVTGFARLALRSGAKRFLLVSSVGATARSLFLYPRTKGESEAAIAALGFTTVVILRPSFLTGTRERERAGEAVAVRFSQIIKPLLIGPMRKYASVDATTVARTLVTQASSAPPGVTIVESDDIR